MKESEVKHFKANQELFDFWISRNERLQASADILKPMIEAYERETEFRVTACQDCIIDALRWCKTQVKNLSLTDGKESKKGSEKTEKLK